MASIIIFKTSHFDYKTKKGRCLKMKRQDSNRQDEIVHVLDYKGEFIAYLEIYGKNKKKVAEAFAIYEHDKKTLTRKDLCEIKEHLETLSGVNKGFIDHVVLDIRQDCCLR